MWLENLNEFQNLTYKPGCAKKNKFEYSLV